MINLALIGAGRWGKNYLESCKSLPGVKIGYVCTRSGSTRIEDLLKKNDIGGFIIATPTSTHFKIAKLLIENDKNVLIEKPVADSYTKTKFLFNLSRKHPKSIVLAGHIQLYDPAYQDLKKKLGQIGKIRKLEYFGLQSPVRSDTSIFWDWAPHPLYLFMDITQKIPKLVSVKSLKPDHAKIILDFNGIVGEIKIGWTFPKKIRELSVIGDKGKLKMKKVKSKYTPLQNEILHFAAVIRGQAKPISDLKQALAVAKIIENAEQMSR